MVTVENKKLLVEHVPSSLAVALVVVCLCMAMTVLEQYGQFVNQRFGAERWLEAPASAGGA